MTFQQKSCVVLVCDGGCIGKGWEDGAPHFGTEAEATTYATGQEWRFADGRATCPHCFQRDLCNDTGHLYTGAWHDREHYGIAFHQRYCDRCDHVDHNPPYGELYPRFAAIREAEELLKAVKP